MTDKIEFSRPRMVFGSVILVTGFLSPLLIPFVTTTDWSVGVISTVSGLLAFGIPEVFMLLAVSIMGKQGYEFIKEKFLRILKRFAPSDEVSLTRYRIGLIMFSIPIVIGLTQPYMVSYFSFFRDTPVWWYIISDILFISSFFVLGGDFWDKLSGLFKYDVKVTKDK
jgi:hypothetical protein